MELCFYSGSHNYPFNTGEGLCKPDHHIDPKFIRSWQFASSSIFKLDKRYPDFAHNITPVFQALHLINLPNLMAHARLFLCTGHNPTEANNSDSLIILFSSTPVEKDSKKWASYIVKDKQYIQVNYAYECVILLKDLLSEAENNWVEFFLKKFEDAKQEKYAKVEAAESHLVNTTREYKAYIALFQ